MSKYIDAECLKAKLDEHYRKYQSKYMETRLPYTQGLLDALDLAEQAINSLQQEQPEADLKKEIDRELDTRWKGEYLSTQKFRESARHFFELGLNARKEQPAQVADASKMERLNVDDLHEWSMRYAPGFREMIEATAYHFWNLAICSMKEE